MPITETKHPVLDQAPLRVNLNPAVKVCSTDDQGLVLFNADTKKLKSLNETGRFIFQKVQGPITMAELIHDLGQEFDGGPYEQLFQDSTDFLDALTQEGYLIAQEQTAPTEIHQIEYSDFNSAPEALDISLTSLCNLRCRYCFYDREMKTRSDLATEKWLHFFNGLGPLPVRTVCLSGGEVFLRKDLWEIIDGLISNRMRYSLLTNGSLITENTLQSFSSGKRLQRLESIQLSLDGSSAQIHDLSRGAGSFQKTIRALQLLRESKFPVTVRVTLNRFNVEDLENIAHLLLVDFGLASFSTNEALPLGAGCTNQASICLTAKQKLRAMQILNELSLTYGHRITASAGPLANLRRYRAMEQAKVNQAVTLDYKKGYLSACGCIFHKLAINHDGSITPCNMLADLVIGHIGHDSLPSLWRSHPILRSLRDRRKIPMTEVPECADCEWSGLCNGSCPALALQCYGDLNRANPSDCYRLFREEVGVRDFI